MPTVSAVSRQLKQLRQKANLSIREVAQALGMEHGSSYQHYEDRYKKPLLPLDFVRRLVPIFATGAVGPAELYELAGVDATGERPLPPAGARNDPGAGMLRVEELDLRASGGWLGGDTASVVAEWQVPCGIVRGYNAATPAELRIITVTGDSMEPTLQPGHRVLVDLGDRKPSPPGIFAVWDGLGLVIKRVQMLPHSEPPRVRLSSDNATYQTYERALEEAFIQGRIIGQWRWL
jgi:hypothetical protein